MKRDVCSMEISAFKSNQAKREGERVEDTSHTRPHSGGIPESVSERYMHRHKYLLLTSTHTHTYEPAKRCAGKCKCLASFGIESMRLIKKQHKSFFFLFVLCQVKGVPPPDRGEVGYSNNSQAFGKRNPFQARAVC